MVGTLGYYPNADGAAFLCRDVVPLLGRNGQPPRVAIVGSKPPESVRALGALPEVSVFADVPDVAPYYAAAKVAVVPLRAGGGSRIKILEAFAHGRPVVSTRIGAEGLAVADGRHLLLADTAEAFAAAVRRLLSDPDLAARLAAEARQLVDERYDFECVAREIEALADPAAGVIECGRG
jgi:glycosyltransferase involved in cell wall biosynthesis